MKIKSLHGLAVTCLLTLTSCDKDHPQPPPTIEYLRQEFHIQLPPTTHTTTTVHGTSAVSPAKTEP
ncbi:hypothetical protein, partial [Prosthecobacter sp.]|uniref:hypothetical protein n=1 Tax=Prosthecobacter sp. TaxID=1965333 RepID=UPI0024882943